MQLQRSIGPIGLLFAAMGGIIGSGWLFGPFYAAQIAGPAAILSWIIGGGLMMLIALTFAELATMLPLSGGLVRFSEISHGSLVGFTMAWISWLSAVIVAPIETMALMQYATNYIPGLMTANEAHTFTLKGVMLSAIIMFSMCVLNVIGAKWIAKTNTSIVFWKLLIPIVTIVLLLCCHFSWHNFSIEGGFMPYGIKGVLQALPQAGVIFSFIGYSPAIQLAGEAKNPQKTIPLAILGSLGLCILLYVFLQFTFIASLMPQSIQKGWHALQFAGDSGPFAGLFVAIGMAWFAKVLFVDAALSPYGTGFIYTAATSRINMAMSEQGYFPKLFASLNRKGVPAKAVGFNFVVGMIFFLPFPGWQSLVTFLISAFVIAYAVGPIALMRLRLTHPNLHRPFKLPAAKVMSLIAFYVCNLIVFWTGWHTVWRILLTISIGYGLYIIHHWQSLKMEKTQWRDGVWLIPHFVGIGLISYLGSFGGGRDLLPFGLDFAVIAVFSWLTFKLAIYPKHKGCGQQIEQKLQLLGISTS